MRSKYLLSVLALAVIGMSLGGSVVPALAKPNEVVFSVKDNATRKPIVGYPIGVMVHTADGLVDLSGYTDSHGRYAFTLDPESSAIVGVDVTIGGSTYDILPMLSRQYSARFFVVVAQ